MVTTPTPPFAVDQHEFDASMLPPECYDEVPEGMEEVDGVFVEKVGMTIKHGAAQANLVSEWRSYDRANQLGGIALTEVPCRTDQQKRRPDVAYLTAELLEQYGQPAILPQSYPLIAEVASPDDLAEALFSKAREYLRSGCQEVWLLFPESKLIMIATANSWQIFTEEEIVKTQVVLPGFSLAVAEVFS
jgi:Uma2 family endonuclease